MPPKIPMHKRLIVGKRLVRLSSQWVWACIISLIFSHAWAANTLTIAVASNFSPTLQQLLPLFEQQHGIAATQVSASSAKLAAQIEYGAPFDVFLSADALHPRLLAQKGKAIAASRFSYAQGSLVLWSKNPDLIDAQGTVLQSQAFHRLALANPRFAPYGQAAKHYLQQQKLWDSLQDKAVFGANIAQTLQFVRLEHADLGFIAHSQWLSVAQQGSYFIPKIDNSLLDQQAIALNNKPQTQAFLQFLRSPSAQAIILKNGYLIPDNQVKAHD